MAERNNPRKAGREARAEADRSAMERLKQPVERALDQYLDSLPNIPNDPVKLAWIKHDFVEEWNTRNLTYNAK